MAELRFGVVSESVRHRAGVAGPRAPDRGRRDRRAADPGSLLGGRVRSAAGAVHRPGLRGRGDHPPPGGHDRALQRLPPSGDRRARGRQPAPRVRGTVRARPRRRLVPARIRRRRDRVRPGGSAHRPARGVAGHHQGPALRYRGAPLRHLVPGGGTGPRRAPGAAQFPAPAGRRGRTAHAAPGRPSCGHRGGASRADQELAGRDDDPADRLPPAFDAKLAVLREAAGDRFAKPGDQRLRRRSSSRTPGAPAPRS